jgi:hypothetical protein
MMRKEKTMMKPEDRLTAEDRTLIGGVAERDLPPPLPKLIQLLQANSLKLLEQIPDAKAGDFGVPRDGEYLLFRGATGIPFLPIGFAQAYVEWGQGRSGYVDAHAKKPRDAIWRDGRDSPDGKAGYVRESSGTRIEDTLYCHLLILSGGAPFGGTFAFRSTARTVGGEFESKAERLKVEGEGLGGLVVGKWLMRSHVEKSGDYRWFTPSIELVGKLREANGPTLEQVRIAAKLRQEFRAGLALEPTPTPAAIAAPARTPRPVVITSGRPVQIAKAVETSPLIDPALDDDINF